MLARSRSDTIIYHGNVDLLLMYLARTCAQLFRTKFLQIASPKCTVIGMSVMSNRMHSEAHVMSANGSLARDDERLVWVDLEMTGLDTDTCHILEMACIITDGQLNLIAEGPNLIINQPEEVMESMNDWCKKHHGDSGLTAAVRSSQVSLQQAEMEMLSFIRQHTPRSKCVLAGNSVHADKKFLDKYMPQFVDHLHYRIVDVSTVKELCRRWYPEKYEGAPRKKMSHRALDDIRESIKELQYYRKTIFK